MFKSKTPAADSILLLLYLAIGSTIILKVHANNTGYLTLDSAFYLELAQNLKAGNGFYSINELPDLAKKTSLNQSIFSLWPIGYPWLIYVTSTITTLHVFWASKVANLILLGLGLLSIRRLNKKYSFVLGAIYCSYTFTEVYAFTWSEAGFVPGTLWLVLIVHNLFQEKQQNRNFILLFLTCLYLFLMRYIGIFTFALPLMGAAYYWKKNQLAKSMKYLFVFTSLCLIAIIYFSLNYYYTGTATGGDRFARDTEGVLQLALMYTKGILNELLIIRNYNFKELPDLLLVATVILQAALLAKITWEVKKTKGLISELKTNTLSHICLFVAGLYLLLVMILRSISPFDALDYRILSPFTYLLLIGAVNYIVAIPEHYYSFRKVKIYIFIFFIISLLLNLPKQYLLRKLTELL